MFDHGSREVIRMPPLTLREIERQALRFLHKVSPANTKSAAPLDLSTLVDVVLPEHGIHVVPADDTELSDAHAVACSEGEPGEPIEVLVRKDIWDGLHHGGSRSHFARATVAHELGHVCLHVPIQRLRRHIGFTFQRARRDEVKCFEEPEWQAWAYGTCLLAPRAAILKSGASCIPDLARFFQTSVDLMEHHVRRLRLDRHFRGKTNHNIF